MQSALQLIRSSRFDRAFRRLGHQNQERVLDALRQSGENPPHPGLNLERVRGAASVWSIRASRAVRVTFDVSGAAPIGPDAVIVLRSVGSHRVYRSP